MTERDISFTSSDGYPLSGTLTLPDVGSSFPAVAIQQGSSNCDRDGNAPRTGFQSTLYRRVARLLADRGIATFRHDKRQFDLPLNQPLTFTLRHRVQDLQAAFQTLMRQPEIDPARASLVGHSEGGVVAQLAAVDVEPARLVVLASPSVSLVQTMTWRIERYKASNTMRRQRTGMEQQAALAEIVRRLRERIDFAPDEYMRHHEQAVRTGALHGGESWPWLVEHRDLKITETTARLPCSTLFLHGDRDRVVSVENLAGYQRAIDATGRGDMKTEIIPGVGHNLEDCTRKAFMVSDAIIAKTAAWLLGE